MFNVVSVDVCFLWCCIRLELLIAVTKIQEILGKVVTLMIETCVLCWLQGCIAVFGDQEAVDASVKGGCDCKVRCTTYCVTVLSVDACDLVEETIGCQTGWACWFTRTTCRDLSWFGKYRVVVFLSCCSTLNCHVAYKDTPIYSWLIIISQTWSCCSFWQFLYLLFILPNYLLSF